MAGRIQSILDAIRVLLPAKRTIILVNTPPAEWENSRKQSMPILSYPLHALPFRAG